MFRLTTSKNQSSILLAFCEWNQWRLTCGFPSQRASNVEHPSLSLSSWKYQFALSRKWLQWLSGSRVCFVFDPWSYKIYLKILWSISNDVVGSEKFIENHENSKPSTIRHWRDNNGVHVYGLGITNLFQIFVLPFELIYWPVVLDITQPCNIYICLLNKWFLISCATYVPDGAEGIWCYVAYATGILQRQRDFKTGEQKIYIFMLHMCKWKTYLQLIFWRHFLGFHQNMSWLLQYLTPHAWMMHICVSKLDRHWFRYWLLESMMIYLNWCFWIILQRNLNKSIPFIKQNQFEISTAIMWPFCLSLNVFMMIIAMGNHTMVSMFMI